jgi:hypothetical protein
VSLADDHKTLVNHLAKLRGHQANVRKAKGELQERAIKQHDSTHEVLDKWAKANEADKAGGILGHRRHRALLVERNRLAAITHQAEAERDADRK